MKFINRNTDYAMRALSYIARRGGEKVSVSEISGRLKISYPFLRKILQRLHKKGYLKAYEGRDGGFSLAHPADKILLVDLKKLFQGPIKLTDCLFKRRICPDIKHCLLKKKIEHIEKLVCAELKTVTIASISARRQHRRS